MNTNNRVIREKKSHEEDDILKESFKLKNKFRHITLYPGAQILMKKFESFYENSSNQVVLDFGCGKGFDSLKLLKSGATVYGIDIAENYITESIELAKKNGFSEDTFKFQVMDAHHLEFEDDKFDLVIGNGILHHLDKELAIKSIYKVLKPGGRLVFKEPLADNPLLKIFRLFTPKARTIDEEPFSKKDLKHMIDPKLWETNDMFFCGILSAPMAMITSILLPKYPNNLFLKITNFFEKKLNKFYFFQSWNQYCLINLKKK